MEPTKLNIPHRVVDQTPENLSPYYRGLLEYTTNNINRNPGGRFKLDDHEKDYKDDSHDQQNPADIIHGNFKKAIIGHSHKYSYCSSLIYDGKPISADVFLKPITVTHDQQPLESSLNSHRAIDQAPKNCSPYYRGLLNTPLNINVNALKLVKHDQKDVDEYSLKALTEQHAPSLDEEKSVVCLDRSCLKPIKVTHTACLELGSFGLNTSLTSDDFESHQQLLSGNQGLNVRREVCIEIMKGDNDHSTQTRPNCHPSLNPFDIRILYQTLSPTQQKHNAIPQNPSLIDDDNDNRSIGATHQISLNPSYQDLMMYDFKNHPSLTPPPSSGNHIGGDGFCWTFINCGHQGRSNATHDQEVCIDISKQCRHEIDDHTHDLITHHAWLQHINQLIKEKSICMRRMSETTLTLAGQAVGAVMANALTNPSSSSSSRAVCLMEFAVVLGLIFTLVGVNLRRKRPSLSVLMTKLGAIATAAAIIISMGLNLPAAMAAVVVTAAVLAVAVAVVLA